MLPPNYVYATLKGYYPRLLAKDGWREALYLPITSASYSITLDLYTDTGVKVDLTGVVPSGQTGVIEWEEGGQTIVDIIPNIATDDVQVSIPEGALTTAQRGTARLTVATSNATYHIFPFEVVVG